MKMKKIFSMIIELNLILFLFSFYFYEIGLALITYFNTNNLFSLITLRNTAYGGHTITIILFLTLCVLFYVRTRNIYYAILIMLFAISYHEMIFNAFFVAYYSIKYNFALDYINYFANLLQYLAYFIISTITLAKTKKQLLKQLITIQFYNLSLFIILAVWIWFGFNVTLNTLTHQINNSISNNIIEITYSLTFLLPYYFVSEPQ